MNQIKTIVWYEWLKLKRSETFWLLNIIFFLISMYAAWYGNNEVRQQQEKIAVLKDSINAQMDMFIKPLQKHDTAAFDYEPLYKTLFCNKPDGMAALAFGQRDLHKFAIEISEGTYFYNKYMTGYSNKTLAGEINNPQKQLAGHFDVSFVIIFLMPLYFILLSYNLLSAEKEQGTLFMLGVQPVTISQIVFSKLLLCWSSAVILSVTVLFIAALITGAANDVRLWIMIAATLLYSLFWAGVITIIIGLKKSSGFNALSLISIWLFFCILLPAFFNSVLNAEYPTLDKIKIINTVRVANAAVYDMPRVVVADSFYKLHPEFNNKPGDTLPGGWYNPRWIRSIDAVSDNKIEPVEKQYFQLLTKRTQITGKLNYASPVLLAQNIFIASAASDAEQMHAYDTACWYNFKKWNSYLDSRIFFKNNRFTNTDFKNLPKFEFKPNIDYSSIFFKLVMLLLWNFILFAAGWKLLNNNIL